MLCFCGEREADCEGREFDGINGFMSKEEMGGSERGGCRRRGRQCQRWDSGMMELTEGDDEQLILGVLVKILPIPLLTNGQFKQSEQCRTI